MSLKQLRNRVKVCTDKKSEIKIVVEKEKSLGKCQTKKKKKTSLSAGGRYQ